MHYECSRCHARVDAGELIGGKCDECRAEEEADRLRRERERSRGSLTGRIIWSGDYQQIGMEEFLNG